MGNCYSTDQTAEDHIHTDIACNIEEPQQKYRLGTVSNRILGSREGVLKPVLLDPNPPSASVIVQLIKPCTTNSTNQQKKLTSDFTYFLFFITKHKRKQSGQQYRWPHC